VPGLYQSLYYILYCSLSLHYSLYCILSYSLSLYYCLYYSLTMKQDCEKLSEDEGGGHREGEVVREDDFPTPTQTPGEPGNYRGTSLIRNAPP